MKGNQCLGEKDSSILPGTYTESWIARPIEPVCSSVVLHVVQLIHDNTLFFDSFDFDTGSHS